MRIVAAPAELGDLVDSYRQHGEPIAFVPTMGNLHAGHLRLVETARQYAPRVVVSIFVNPLQFGVNEDFNRYPRTPDHDYKLLQDRQVDMVFVPEVVTLYPNGAQRCSYVEVPGLTALLEGAHRPEHFRGVATVVAKLFHLVQPQVAVFGEKDYQQLVIIRRMVQDLDFPLRVVAVPTVREHDGLAMSSRNGFLTTAERRLAPMLYRTLCGLRDHLVAGERGFTRLEADAARLLAEAGWVPDYVAVRNRHTLLSPQSPEDPLIILAAARLGHTRLIDNLPVGPT
ncbi:MAG: pantoate--beta-alanine ligase [Gammaproteobacteria bacterium]|nr:pantoate--beta-alanine ligase [Gammaproteobacteria bacterium]